MYVEKTPNGTYKYVEAYKDHLTGKWKRVSITSTKNTKEKDEWKYLEREELQEIIDHFRSTNQHEMARYVILQANTGMRFNELMAVDYSKDIDLEKGLLHIRRNYDPNNNVFTTPKTGETRSIYLQTD